MNGMERTRECGGLRATVLLQSSLACSTFVVDVDFYFYFYSSRLPVLTKLIKTFF